MDEWLGSAAMQLSDASDELIERQWINTMLAWHGRGYTITLLREEI